MTTRKEQREKRYWQILSVGLDQFMRKGYFCVDNRDSAPGHLVFNRCVALKDNFSVSKK